MSLNYDGQTINSMKWNGQEILGGGGTIVGGDGLPADWEDGLVICYAPFPSSSIMDEYWTCLNQQESNNLISAINTDNSSDYTLDTLKYVTFSIADNNSGKVKMANTNSYVIQLLATRGYTVSSYSSYSYSCNLTVFHNRYYASFPSNYLQQSTNSTAYVFRAYPWELAYWRYFSGSSYYKKRAFFAISGTPKYWCAPIDCHGFTSVVNTGGKDGPVYYKSSNYIFIDGVDKSSQYAPHQPRSRSSNYTSQSGFLDIFDILKDKVCMSRCLNAQGMFGYEGTHPELRVTNELDVQNISFGYCLPSVDSFVFPESWDFASLKYAKNAIDGANYTQCFTDITMTSDQWAQLEAAGATIGSWQTLHLT